MVFHRMSDSTGRTDRRNNLINFPGLSVTQAMGPSTASPAGIAPLSGSIKVVGEQLNKAMDLGVQVSNRLNQLQQSAGMYASGADDGISRLGAGADPYRSGLEVIAATNHFAAANGVMDMGQDVSMEGSPMNLVEMVLGQMAGLGEAAIEHQASNLPGM